MGAENAATGGATTGGATTGGATTGGAPGSGGSKGGAPSGGATNGGTAGRGPAGLGGAGEGGGGGAVVPPPAISARAAADSMGKGFNLGQLFESTQHPRTLAAASAKIDAYYAKGFRHVRIPITWTEPVGGDLLVNDASVGDVNRAQPRLAVIEQVVDHALSKSEMYVIINAHHEQTLKTEGRSAVLERLWADIADVFRQRDHRLIFELLNEPHRADDSALPPAELREMSARAYEKIRAVDAERLVVIGGNRWFAASELAAVWPTLDGVGGGTDLYLMATFHHYDPWTFCGDNQGTYDDAWTDGNLATPMDTALSWANSAGIGLPVFIGEWGVGWGSRYTEMDCNNIRLWYQKMHTENAAPKGIPSTVWDDGGWFKIFDHDTVDYANNLADCIGGACDLSGTERFNAGCQ